MATNSIYLPPNSSIPSPTLAEFFLMMWFLTVLFTVSLFLSVGIDTWVRLHARMVVMLPKFNRTVQACRKKFNQVFASYKEDKLANGISDNNPQESKFYDALDRWYHQAGQVFKDVSATTNDSANFQTNSSPEIESTPTSTPSSTSKPKSNFQERSIDIFERMAETSIGLMKNFERTNELLERVDHQFDRLINKL
ncbi:hypothetical protein KC19_VG300500 [Ceratodon purpureus]|uniref:Uncharacterized protein n=1 Tax=Ceratodon purpureus TaxID=3225 RepID=A0A8T0HV64_CERPU|nr:hypothetical protein KC19_VG300500 [Ceratodon purpureus]